MMSKLLPEAGHRGKVFLPINKGKVSGEGHNVEAFIRIGSRKM